MSAEVLRTSPDYIRVCQCGERVRVIDNADQPHDHKRERIEVTDALARSIDKYARPTIIRDISKQKRPKR